MTAFLFREIDEECGDLAVLQWIFRIQHRRAN